VFVAPEIVVSVRFLGWTEDGRLRAPVFRGIREDIEPAECTARPESSASPEGARGWIAFEIAKGAEGADLPRAAAALRAVLARAALPCSATTPIGPSLFVVAAVGGAPPDAAAALGALVAALASRDAEGAHARITLLTANPSPKLHELARSLGGAEVDLAAAAAELERRVRGGDA
jgi:hypothetical protein